ncbi:alpha/beta hydrolase [Nocardioides caldifontis]|uniref:alpha/beta hydrolase n=1 Tax=Nocardioides caldifontis TaxID=2588938 RepID=UPI0011DF8B21|nr:alpha/beta hydrolase [Nocardioides caldifontis]
MGYLRRQGVVAALAANALRPAPLYSAGVPAMFAGWLTSELAAHLTAATAVDTGRELVRGRPRRALVGAANLAALGYLLRQGGTSQHVFDKALAEALGEDYRSRLEERYDDLAWRTPVQQLLWPFRHHGPASFEVVKDVPYAPEHGKRGLLDVYKPTGDVTGAPVLLQVHGGAWTLGTKDQQGLPLMRHMAARGWVCVALNYRLSPRDKWPAQIVDVKRSIAWIREHIAEHGGDPDFVAVTGGSAGGHLAALAALTPGDPEYQPGFEDADTSLQAAVPFYGVYDLAGATGSKAARKMRDTFLARWVFEADPRKDLTPYEKASPLLRVRKDAPPFYVVHGGNDTLVEVAQARAFVEALRESSEQAVAYSELPVTHHAFDVFPSIRSQHSVRHVDRFLRWAHDEWRGVATRSAESWERSDPAQEEAASA